MESRTILNPITVKKAVQPHNIANAGVRKLEVGDCCHWTILEKLSFRELSQLLY